MNLIISLTLAIVFASHSSDSSVWPIRPDQIKIPDPSGSSHTVVRRATLPYWLHRHLRNGGRIHSAEFLRKNRHTDDIFTEDTVALEPYIQPAQNTGNVIAPNPSAEDDMFSGFANADKVVINPAVPVEGAATIDFGVQDRRKNKFPHGGSRPACNKTEGVGASEDHKSEMVNGSSSVDFIDQSVWTPLVNESRCQSYGPSYFCEDATNYPAEAIRKILVSDNGGLLTTFFTNNIQPLASSSQPDESMEMAQRKPDLSTAVTAHAINTRIRPLASDTKPLCDSMPGYHFPTSAKNKDNEMLNVINQEGIQQPVTTETCRSRGGPCQHVKDFPFGYTAVCVQKYMTHHLAALRNGTIVREAFSFPSCCVCELKRSD